MFITYSPSAEGSYVRYSLFYSHMIYNRLQFHNKISYNSVGGDAAYAEGTAMSGDQTEPAGETLDAPLKTVGIN